MAASIKNRYEDFHELRNQIIYKKCSNCLIWFEMNEQFFYKNKSNKIDGFNPYCKSCTKMRSTKWRNDNLRKHKMHIKKYRASEKGNRTKNKLDKDYRDSGKYKEWCDNNRNSLRKYRVIRTEYKSHNISHEEWIACKTYFNNCCAYCGLKIEEQYHIFNKDFSRDHADDDGANDLSNCLPSCSSCNSRKWKHDMLKWYKRQKYFSQQKLTTIELWLSTDFKKYIKISM